MTDVLKKEAMPFIYLSETRHQVRSPFGDATTDDLIAKTCSQQQDDDNSSWKNALHC